MGISGEGIIVRSAWDVEHEVASGGLVKLLTQYELPDADIVALVAGERLHSSPRVDGFITLLKERLSKRPWENKKSPRASEGYHLGIAVNYYYERRDRITLLNLKCHR